MRVPSLVELCSVTPPAGSVWAQAGGIPEEANVSLEGSGAVAMTLGLHSQPCPPALACTVVGGCSLPTCASGWGRDQSGGLRGPLG